MHQSFYRMLGAFELNYSKQGLLILKYSTQLVNSAQSSKQHGLYKREQGGYMNGLVGSGLELQPEGITSSIIFFVNKAADAQQNVLIIMLCLSTLDLPVINYGSVILYFWLLIVIYRQSLIFSSITKKHLLANFYANIDIYFLLKHK